MFADPVINNLKLSEEKNVAPKADNKNHPPVKAISGGNDNTQSKAVLTTREIHPLVKEAAKRLINYHTAQTPVVIESWGTAKYVYREIREKLIAFGYQIDMAENMAQKLVDHAVDHAEANRSKHGSDIVALKLQVSNAKPDPQFETGALDVQRLDGKSDSAEVAGATSVAMGINTGGTFTTALRDSVGEILNSYALMGQALYILSELPDKSELQGVAHQAAMSAVAVSRW